MKVQMKYPADLQHVLPLLPLLQLPTVTSPSLSNILFGALENHICQLPLLKPLPHLRMPYNGNINIARPNLFYLISEEKTVGHRSTRNCPPPRHYTCKCC